MRYDQDVEIFNIISINYCEFSQTVGPKTQFSLLRFELFECFLVLFIHQTYMHRDLREKNSNQYTVHTRRQLFKTTTEYLA